MSNKVKLFKRSEHSKQIDHKESGLFQSSEKIIEPSFDFEVLLYAYENSSIISWIIKKISAKINAWFQETENEELNKLLKNLDIETIASNMLVFWNSFSERLTNMKEEQLLEFENIITPTIRIAERDNKDKASFYQRSKTGIKKVPFKKDEVLFFKRNSLSDRDYGDSLFATCIDEISLLAFITKYYKNFFKGWNIEPNILFDKNGTLTDEQVEKIENMIKDKISWIENSHNTLFLQWEIWKIDLTTKIDPDKFIALKRELKEDIAIGTNIPFDLLSSQNSNRATSWVSMETLYSDIIKPAQNRILTQLKRQLREWGLENISDDDIDSIEFKNIKLGDPYEEMKTLTGYQKSWNLSQNEVRSKAGLWDDIEWGDEYKIHSWKDDEEKEEEKDLDKIQEEIEKMYSNKKIEKKEKWFFWKFFNK